MEGLERDDSTNEVNTTTVEQIVTFQDEGSIVRSGLTLPVSQPEILASSAKETRQHSVTDFLKRPMLLKTFSWPNTSTPGTDLVRLRLPENLFSQPAFREKMAGFTYFRADSVLRVQCCSQPFQQGRMIVYFLPNYENFVNFIPQQYHLTSITGCPHVDLDLSQSQTMELRIPFVAPMTHLNLVTKEWNLGDVRCVVYGQLAGGDAEIECTVWGHFENVEITVPTGLNLYTPNPAMDFDAVTTIGVTRAQIDLGLEKAAGSEKPISAVAKTIADIAGVAAMIPGLATIAAPVAAVAGVVGNTAESFGYSKVTSEAAIVPTTPSIARYGNNFNGVDMSKKLGLDATNSIGQDPIFGSGVDELSLAYVAGNFNYYRAFPFTKTQPAGTVLWKSQVSPVGEIQDDQTKYPNEYYLTHLAFVSRMFAFWRGSIKYKFRFVKTKFHAGRLRVLFVPGGLPASTVDINKCYSEVIDLKDKSEFDFTVPFVYNRPWVRLESNQKTPPAIGTVVVLVVNELRTPSTLVSDTISVIVEKAGGEDIEFALPGHIEGFPLVADTGAPPTKATTRAQMWDPSTRDEDQINLGDSKELFSTTSRLTPKIPLATVGEQVVSFRQLLKRFQGIARLDLTGAQNACNLNPWAVVGLGDTKTPQAFPNVDYFSYLMTIYAFMRGSVRIKLFHLNLDIKVRFEQLAYSGLRQQAWPASVVTDVTADDTAQFLRSSEVINNPQIEGAFEAELPFYHDYALAPSPAYVLRGNFIPPAALPFLRYDSGEEPETRMEVYRAVGDDFSAGFLIGAPPVWIDPSTWV